MANVQDADILSAFVQQLGTISGGYRVAYENRAFDPDPAETWLEVFMLPARTVQAELGDLGYNLRKGIFQVTVHATKGTSGGAGAGDGLDVVGKVIDLFKRGSTLAYGSVSDIRLVMASRGPRMANADWYSIPVSVEWYAFTSNTP